MRRCLGCWLEELLGKATKSLPARILTKDQPEIKIGMKYVIAIIIHYYI
jgi:hypothetical protein